MELLNLDAQLESKEKKGNLLTYHHSRPLEVVRFGVVKQESPLNYTRTDKEREDAEMDDKAFKWLQEQIGFYPLFVAVGRRDTDVRDTGYQDNWVKKLISGRDFSVIRKAGEAPNQVFVRNEAIRKELLKIGFKNISVGRMKVSD